MVEKRIAALYIIWMGYVYQAHSIAGRMKAKDIYKLLLLSVFLVGCWTVRTARNIHEGNHTKASKLFERAKSSGKETRDFPKTHELCSLFLDCMVVGKETCCIKKEKRGATKDDVDLYSRLLEDGPVGDSLVAYDARAFRVAKAKDVVAEYFKYLDCRMPRKGHVKEAEDSVFSKLTPSLFKFCAHQQKSNELVEFLSHPKTAGFHNRRLAMGHLITVFTADGSSASYERFKKSKMFAECYTISELSARVEMEEKDARIAEAHLDGEGVVTEAVDSLIQRLWPRETSYRLMQRRVAGLIDNYQLPSAAKVLRELKIDPTPAAVLPEMNLKLVKTIELFERSTVRAEPVSWNSREYQFEPGDVVRPMESTNWRYAQVYPDSLANRPVIGLSVAKKGVSAGSVEQRATDVDYPYIDPYEKGWAMRTERNGELTLFTSDKPMFEGWLDPKAPRSSVHREVLSSNASEGNRGLTIDYWHDPESKRTFTSRASNQARNAQDGMSVETPYDENNSAYPTGSVDIFEEKGKDPTPFYLGDTINTRYAEVGPQWFRDTLYFSSDGLPGFGGMDVYRTYWTKQGWAYPENLGLGVNSTSDDLNYKRYLETACFQSNRSGTRFMAYGAIDHRPSQKQTVLLYTRLVSKDQILGNTAVQVTVTGLGKGKNSQSAVFASKDGELYIPVVVTDANDKFFIAIRVGSLYKHFVVEANSLVDAAPVVSKEGGVAQQPIPGLDSLGSAHAIEAARVTGATSVSPLGVQVLQNARDSVGELISSTPGGLPFRVYYNTNEVYPEDSISMEALNLAIIQFLNLLRENRDLESDLYVEGYADTTGAVDHNLWLSRERARNTANMMGVHLYKVPPDLERRFSVKTWPGGRESRFSLKELWRNRIVQFRIHKRRNQ